MAQTSRKHALIIVDLQKDFLPGGALAVPGGDKIVPVIREVLEKNSWDCIVMTQDWHPAGHVSFARNHEGRHVLDVMGVSGFLCLGRLFQGQPNEAALCI